ncbi:hypothetical protein BDF21DRAFT_398054 [Thamnidium elegans]|nr:hypothetical protein BDF21DRAFT_398054 [Thamnidium elegans]
MSKIIIQEPKVTNFIKEALTKTKNDYFIGNCEWKNGICSDIVLEPKCPTLDLSLSLIIVEIKHTVNKKFLRRCINYCLQAISRYDVEPILLIICVDTVHQDIKDNLVYSYPPGALSYLSKPWASDCFIMCHDSIKQNITTRLDPLITLGLFFL